MYKTQIINDNSLKIVDSYGDAMYLLLGSHHALLIDAGMEKEDLSVFVSSLTSLPVIIALSHGHIDHIGRSGDFDFVFMDESDRDTYLSHMHMNKGHFQNDGLNFKSLDKIQPIPNFFDLGDRIISVVALHGHTPGSVIFVDQQQKMIFTGDAIGSGCGCWMQLDESLSIKMYRQNLQSVINKFNDLKVDNEWLFYGGHDQQEYQSKISEFNRLDFELLNDMEQLSTKLLQRKIKFRDTKALKMTYQPFYVSFQKAEMIVVKEKI